MSLLFAVVVGVLSYSYFLLILELGRRFGGHDD